MTSYPKEICAGTFALAAEWLIPMDITMEPQQDNGQKPTNLSEAVLSKSVLSEHALVVSGRKIIDILPQTDLPGKYPDIETLALPEMAIMPGLINAHTHAAKSLLKGCADHFPIERQKEVLQLVEDNLLGDDFVFDGTQLAIAQMLRSGTTCFQDTYYQPDQTARAVDQSNMRANVGLMVMESENVWAKNAEQCINKALDVNDKFKHHSNLTFSFASNNPNTMSEASLKKIASLSFELNLNVQMQVSGTAQDERQLEHQNARQNKMRPLEKLDQLGLLSPQFNALYASQLNDSELAHLAESGAHVIYCPQSEQQPTNDSCKLGELVEYNVNIAIGTGCAVKTNSFNMLPELQVAALQAQSQSNAPLSLVAYQALYAATMGGAKALGIEETVGSLVIGKEADLVAIDLSPIETQPIYQPISQIVYAASRDQIKHVWVAGEHLLNDRRLTSLDETKLVKKAKKWQQKIEQLTSKQLSGR